MSAIVMASPITLGTRPLNIKLWDITHCVRKSMESIEGPWKNKKKGKKMNRYKCNKQNFFLNI